MRNLKK